MEWEEISRRLKNGTSVQILADLDGVPYKTMYNRIKYHERQTGEKLIPDSDKKIYKPKKKKKVEARKEEPKTEPIMEIAPEKNLTFAHGVEISADTGNMLEGICEELKGKLNIELSVVQSLQRQLNDIQRILAFCRKEEAET